MMVITDEMREKIREKLVWTDDFLQKAMVQDYVIRMLVTDKTGLLIEDFMSDKDESESTGPVEEKVRSLDGDQSAAFISGILAQSDKLLLDSYDLQSESHIISTVKGPTVLLYSIDCRNENIPHCGCYLAIFTNGAEMALQKIGTGISFLRYGIKTILDNHLQ